MYKCISTVCYVVSMVILLLSIIIGIVLQFLYSCFVGSWCFHILHLFLGLAFPFQMKLWLDSPSRRKKIHITEVTIVALFGLLSPIIAVNITRYQDNGWFCTPQCQSVAFYGALLPDIAVFCIGLGFLFTSLWILRKVSLCVYKS